MEENKLGVAADMKIKVRDYKTLTTDLHFNA